jgi:hypothetical protein
VRSPKAIGAASLLVAALAFGVSVVSAAPASASTGSVPLQVTKLLGDPALADKLTELYGPGSDDAGVDFTGATFGSVSRIFVFTAPDLVSIEDSTGKDSTAPAASVIPSATATPGAKPPIRRINEWAAVVSIDKKPVGVATIAYPSGSTVASLAGFSPDRELAAALPLLKATAALLRDSGNGAWMSVANGTATPLVAGKTKLTAPVSLVDYPRAESVTRAPAAPASTGMDPGIVIGGVTLLLVVGAIVLVLFLPRRKRDGA